MYAYIEKELLLQRFENLQEAQRQLRTELSELRDADRVKRLLAVLEEKPDPGKSRIEYPSANAFRLYDTYGLPRDFIQEVCRDLKIDFDQTCFDKANQDTPA